METAPVAPANGMVSFPQAIMLALRKYSDFSGRASRAEYWWWVLALWIGNSIFWNLDRSILSVSEEGAFSPFGSIFFLVVFLPSLAVTARRLHDLGRTGWWQVAWGSLVGLGWIPLAIGAFLSLIGGIGALIGGIPDLISTWDFGEFFGNLLAALIGPVLVGFVITALLYLGTFIWWIVWMTKRGVAGPNRFGPDPLA